MFDGFTLDDFEAYLPEKWSSNMFTLPRRRVKDKLETLGQLLDGQLKEEGLPLVMHLSDDHPSLWNRKKVDTQWLFFSRDEDAQKELSEIIDTEKTLAATLADPTPLYRHVFMGVSVNQDHLEIGLRLHNDAWVDRKNLIALVGTPESGEKFDSLRAGLPEGFVMGLVGCEMTSAAQIDSEGLGELIGEFVEKKGWIFLGTRIPAADAAALGGEIEARIVDAFAALIPLYRFFAWSPSNDAVSIDTIVADKQKELEASQAALEKERREREERRREEEERRVALRREAEEKARQDQEWRERERAMRRAAARAAHEAQERAETEALATGPAKSPADPEKPRVDPEKPPLKEEPPRTRPDREPPRRSSNRSEQRPARPRREARPPQKQAARVSKERMDDIHVGDGVIVQKGFLEGRFGIVQSVDEKGDLKVVFGALTSRVPRADVEGRGPAPDRPDPASRRRK